MKKGLQKQKIVKNAFVNPYQIFNVDSKILSSIKSLSYDENSFTIIFDENQTPGISFFLFLMFYQDYILLIVNTLKQKVEELMNMVQTQASF
ncbi:hypothetical protein NW739_05160 [Mycoplasmopsis felis]|uniref:hypothetical protein n=1 Tax=Mycoplasmopsis felis TaxID=33923 RepID=UPI0021E015B6|nr:hypothetical protein [Mycoplasmopsis felis]MCU9940070.1 hypothetical protein [Mycoplasmopsis felis]